MRELNGQIGGLEKDRNNHNEEAGKKSAEAIKYERKAKGGKTLDPAIEQRLRDAAVAKGLNPDTAVKRALARQ